MSNDRRKRRAHSPLLAAEHFLEAELGRCSAAALFLLERGEVIASTMRVGERVALVDAFQGAIAPGPDGRDLYAHVLEVPGRELLLASVGARVRSVREVERSIGRIFSE